MSTGTGIRIAQAIGISGSAFISGSILSISAISAPVLLTSTSFFSPTHAAIQWKNLYNRGASIMPPLSLITSLAHFYVAWRVYAVESQLIDSASLTKKYLLAGALTIGIVPWTMFAMKPTNDALMQKAVDSPAEATLARTRTNETEELVEKWITLNLMRGLLPLAGTVVAVFATLL